MQMLQVADAHAESVNAGVKAEDGVGAGQQGMFAVSNLVLYIPR